MINDYYKTIANIDLSTVQLRSNYHTHNYLCGHAGGTVSDYAAEAVKHGMTALGISDHCIAPFGLTVPLLKKCIFFTKYLPQFDEARDKFGDKLKLYVGVETEYFDGHDDFYKFVAERVDYMVLGQHEYMHGAAVENPYFDGNNDDSIRAYIKCVRQGLARGYFAVLAHPDLIFYTRPKISAKVKAEFDGMIRDAAQLGVAVELNSNGIRFHEFRYPTDLLIDCCKIHNAKVVISADAHSPDALCDDCQRGLVAYAKAQGLRVVDEIKMMQK